MSNGKLNIALAFSIVSAIVSIMAICVSLKDFSMGDMAYVGMIIAVLSMLVVVLMGWNIYTVIDIRGIKDEADRKIKEGYLLIGESISHDLYKELFEMLARKPTLSDSCEPFIRYGLQYVEAAVHLKKEDSVNIAYAVFSDFINKEKIPLRETEKNNIRLIVNRISSIPNVYRMDKCIMLLNIIDTYLHKK